MPRVLNEAVVQKELESVAARLLAPNVTTEQRLVLLRRQAELGDLRDALADRERHRQA
jgi:hypothetical protein